MTRKCTVSAETTPAVEAQEGRQYFHLISVFDVAQTNEIEEKKEEVAA